MITFIRATPYRIVLQVISFLAAYLFAFNVSRAQLTPEIQEICEIQHSSGWVRFNGRAPVDAKTLFVDHKQKFGLGRLDSMHLVSSKTDTYGYTHHRFKQYHDGIRVEGAMFIVHERNGRAIKANGKIASNMHMQTKPHIAKQSALMKAVESVPSKQYAWEDKEFEQFTKEIAKDPSATNFPKVDLIITRRFDSLEVATNNLVLAYRVTVPTLDQPGGYAVYVGARDGNIIRRVPLARGCTAAQANTIYNGEKTINTVWNGSAWTLKDDCQTTTIETMAYNTQTTQDDVTHTSTDWTSNSALTPYTQAHWCAMKAYEYFDVQGLSDYSEYDSRMLTVVGGTEGVHWWGAINKRYIQITNTTGVFSTDWPSTLDVIGHEWAHAVTEMAIGMESGSYPVGEFGAVYESFGYIFGEAVEWFAKETTIPTELIGGQETFYEQYQKKLCERGVAYLDTYCDDNWEATDEFHARAGVQNNWFCLLVYGGEGHNDHCCDDRDYNVDDIGLEKAAKITFRNLTTYITEASNYVDARLGSIEAAEDEYGQGNEYNQVIEAWNAVGVYDNEVGWDFRLCGVFTVDREIKAMNNIVAGDLCTTIEPSEISVGADVEFKAGNKVRLTQGFVANSGCYFRASIVGDFCTELFNKQLGYSADTRSNNTTLTRADVALMPTMLITPNPIDGEAIVHYTLERQSIVNLSIIDLNGVVVLKNPSINHSSKGKYTQLIDTQGLNQGVYFCLLESNGVTISMKLIIQ